MASVTVLRAELWRDMRDQVVVMRYTQVVVGEFREYVLAELSVSYTGLPEGVQSDIFFCQVKIGLKVKGTQKCQRSPERVAGNKNCRVGMPFFDFCNESSHLIFYMFISIKEPLVNL